MTKDFLAATTLCLLAAASGSRPDAQQSSTPPPLDPQRVQDQETMTWKDYRPIPGTSWADNSVPGARVLRVALVAVDFPDQPFVITMPLVQPAGPAPEVRVELRHLLALDRRKGPICLAIRRWIRRAAVGAVLSAPGRELGDHHPRDRALRVPHLRRS